MQPSHLHTFVFYALVFLVLVLLSTLHLPAMAADADNPAIVCSSYRAAALIIGDL